jgi:DNA-binding transcriptional ArsR family regulator
MTDGAGMLGALSDATRQTVLNLLRRGPATVGELAGQLPVSRPAVSQHLQVLKAAGLVEEERRGTRHYFRLNPKSLAELRSHIDSMWRDALSALAALSEESRDEPRKRKTRTDPKKRPPRLPG